MVMENQKNQKNSVVDLKRLDRFIHRISGTRETPALIQMVAGSGEWMELIRELVNTAPENDPELWRQFSRACRRRNQDPDKLRARLVPVAQSLGLIVHDNQQQDYYILLGIDSLASSEEVQKAYHRKAKSLHPDTRESGGDDQAFIQLTDGYRVLKDPVLRAHYDQSRQSMDAWCEGPECVDEDIDEAGRKSRRSRYILQLSGVVALMIFTALIFNMIYESRAINDGFYIAPEPEKSVSDSSEKKIVEKNPEADRRGDRLKQDSPKGESPAPDLSERATSISSRDGDKKTNPVSFGISNLDRKQVVRSDLTVSSDEKIHSPPSPNIEIKDKEGINKVAEVKPEKKPDENKVPPLQEKNRAENNPGLNQQRAGREADHDTAKKASVLLQKFAEEEGEIQRVSAFIRTYSETYEKRDYAEFSRLFTEDATENGKAFSELVSDYRRTFTIIEKLEYKIELHKTSLFVDQEVIRTEGIYKIVWQPYEGDRGESEGPISFEIVKRNGEYRVRKLKYDQIKPK